MRPARTPTSAPVAIGSSVTLQATGAASPSPTPTSTQAPTAAATASTAAPIATGPVGTFPIASLPAIPNRTPVVYVTLATSTGGNLQFQSLTGITTTFTGTLFTPGTQYAVAYTINGVALGGVQLTTAITSSFPNDPGGEIDVPTPFSNLVLPVDNVLGIVVGK